MRPRLWCLLLGVAGLFGASSAFGEAPAAEKPASAEKPPKPSASWSLDFWPRWPKATDGFIDCYAATGSDALALGYYVDPRSISPDHRYGVLVPWLDVMPFEPDFVVELAPRRIVGALKGPSVVVPMHAPAGWTFHWAPDSASLVVEKAGQVFKQAWGRVSWQLIELRDGYIAKETSLLTEPGKAPAWLDTKAEPTVERSSPPKETVPAVLAESSPEAGAWSVERDPGGGPLHLVHGGARVETLPPVRAMGADAKGAVREMSSDEMPGLPLCFFSMDGKWLFVNQFARVDPVTHYQWRVAAVYGRNDSDDGKNSTWQFPMAGSFNDLAWDAFARHNEVPPETVAPPDATGFRDRTIEFVNWSAKSGRTLLYLHARNGSVKDHAGRPAYYRGYCYFNTATLAIETDLNLDAANAELRTRWNSGDESLDAPNVQWRVAEPGSSSHFAPPADIESMADDELNASYKALLERIGKQAADEKRKEQRAWLAYRETMAQVHALNCWPRFTSAAVEEGRFLATHLRAEELKAAAMEARPEANTVEKEKSPDGKFGLRYTFADDDLAHDGRPQGVELIELASQRSVLDLYDETTNRDLKASWAPDSKHFAFHAGSHRVAGFTIYEFRGGKFEALDGPNVDHFSPKMEKGERTYHFNYSDLTLKRWPGPKKLLAHYGIGEDVDGGKAGAHMATADFDLVLSIEKGKVVIEKVTKTKSEN